MTRTAKQSVAVFLAVAALGIVTWRLWPDGGRARQQHRDHDLVRAVQVNDLAAATHLLNQGADPNAPHPALSLSKKTQAYYFGVSHGIMRIQDWGRLDDMNPRWSVLQIAVMRGNADMVGLLLSRGADAGYRDRQGSTALVWAGREQSMTQKAVRSDRNYPRIVALLKAARAREKARR